MSQEESLTSLLSVLGRTIIVVSMGILSRKFDWIPADTAALSIVVGKIALPAIFFSFAASLDLGSYDWAPIISIVITRILMIAFCGFIAWIWKMKPFFSAWGVMGFFVTQSNDIAIGIPIINALWDNDTTHFGDYAIIFSTLALLTSSLCIALILIGETSRTATAQREHMEALSKNMTEEEYDRFLNTSRNTEAEMDPVDGKPVKSNSSINCELKKRRKSSKALSVDSVDGSYRILRDSEHSEPSKHSQISDVSADSMFRDSNCWKVTKALFKNELLLAVLFGGLVNVLCKSMGKSTIPPFFQDLLHTMSSPFDFIALYLMGIGMAGKVSIGTFFGRKALFPFVLVGIKLVIYPITARGILTQLWPLSDLSGSGSYDDYQNFLFVYGAIPPAIAPVILAQSFNVMPDRILNAMMMALILCAPYMFVISLIIGVHTGEDTDTLPHTINMMGEVMNITSVISGLLLLSACILHKPWRRFPMPLIGGLVLCQALFSLFKLPCDYVAYTEFDMIEWVYFGNCFFRWAAHMAFVVLSVLNALSRTKPCLVWNYIRFWYIGTPILVVLSGLFGGLLEDLSAPPPPQWVGGYHTFCWLWYDTQMNVSIGALMAGIVVIVYTLSISAYYRMVPNQEVCKLKDNANVSQFIIKQHSSVDLLDDDDETHLRKTDCLQNSFFGASTAMENETSASVKLTMDENGDNNDNDCSPMERVGDVSSSHFDAFYKAEIGIDFGFRLQCIVICELLRMVLSLTFILWIKTDKGDTADQSFYLMELIARFVADAQGFITFLAFCVSDPFIAYLKDVFEAVTCGAFRKSNPLAQAVGPSKYVLR